MLGVLSHTRVLRLAGLFTWVMVGLPLAYSQFENLHSRSDMGSWAILLFVAYLSSAPRTLADPPPRAATATVTPPGWTAACCCC
jgi:hypothetical protein